MGPRLDRIRHGLAILAGALTSSNLEMQLLREYTSSVPPTRAEGRESGGRADDGKLQMRARDPDDEDGSGVGIENGKVFANRVRE